MARGYALEIDYGHHFAFTDLLDANAADDVLGLVAPAVPDPEHSSHHTLRRERYDPIRHKCTGRGVDDDVEPTVREGYEWVVCEIAILEDVAVRSLDSVGL